VPIFAAELIWAQSHRLPSAALSPRAAIPIYAVSWRAEGFIKFGWSANVPQRLADGFGDNSHPPALCHKLTRDHFTVLGIWDATAEDEQQLQMQYNEGILKRKDNHNEFYQDSEGPKIFRELDTCFQRLPFPQEVPPSKNQKRMRPCCRGWSHWCDSCGTKFANNANRKRHLAHPPPSCVAAKRAKNMPQEF